MKKKGLIILIGIVMCCLVTACGTEASSDNESKTQQATETNEKLKESLAKLEAKQKAQKSNYNLTYDLVSDVESGLLYYTEAGKLTDPDGKVIPEYDEFYVSNGYVIYAEAACEGFYAEDGKIVYREPKPIEYLSGIEKLRACASWDNCTTSIQERYSGTRIDDDGDYFDEVVLGAWFDESGVPIGEHLPDTLYAALFLNGDGSPNTKNLKFIDSENCTVDKIKRSSVETRNFSKTTYAFVLSDIVKRESNNEAYIVGREFTSGELLVVHGKFNKILNGDDLLVFGWFTGLASDDTPNFQGEYIQIINGRLD